jgi:hypothetical protein
MAELEKSDHGEAGEPATKRARLESVVPAPVPPPAKQAAKPQPPLPKPVAPPLWLSGQLPSTQKSTSRDSGRGGWRGGRGRGRGGGRGKIVIFSYEKSIPTFFNVCKVLNLKIISKSGLTDL